MGDMSTDLDNEGITQTEQDLAFSFPELNRLHSFIRDLEDELECETTEQDMFKSVSFDDGHDSDGELESELRDIHHREDLDAERLMTDVPVTPIDDLYRGFTPHHTPHFGVQTHSNLDIFLLALAEAGYADVDPGPIQTEPPSGFTTIANEFFDSALQNGEHSPITNPTLNTDYDNLHTIAPAQPSQPTDGSPRKRHSLSIGIEHVTAESLRRNWDLDDDDENDDSGGSSSGGISPTSPYGTKNTTVSKTNSSMQFPDLLSSPATPSQQGQPFLSPSSYDGERSGGKGKMQVDPRLHGDFNVWSGGPMLSAEAIQREYLGLYPTALTHHIQDGRLLPCADLVERVATMTSARKQSGRSFYEGPFDVHEIPQGGGSSSPFSPGWSHSNTSTARRLSNANNPSLASRSIPHTTLPYFYNRHVMECVLRPDRELKHIVIDLMRFFFDRDEICHQLQANHLVVFPALKAASSAASPSVPNASTTANRTATNANAHDTATDESMYEDIVVSNDWDLLDIQVCLSRELKQHILLVQFLQRVPTGLVEATGFAVGSTGMVNGSGSFVGGGGSHGHVLICADVIPDSLPLRACPATRKLAVHLKKLLIAEHLTLSALYTVPIPEVCALPRGLDTHFVALLQSLTREQLWTRLRQEYRTMDEHVQEMENYTTQFAKLLEPIYKAYGMSIQDMVFKPSPLPAIGNPPPVKVGSSKATSTTRKRHSDATGSGGSGGDGRHQRAGSLGAMAIVGHREAQREDEAIRRATIAGMYTTTVEEDHLVAVRHPFPTGGDANSVVSTASTRVLGAGAAEAAAEAEATAVEPPLPPVPGEIVASQPLLSLTQPPPTTPLPPPARPSALKSPRASLPSDGQQGPLPPKTPTRSVTIRLDTNTFHEAVPPPSSSSPPSTTNAVDSTTTFSTPTRGSSSFPFPETPLSALTESPASMGMTTPTRPPTTDDASATTNTTGVGGGDESMSTVLLTPSTTASFTRKSKENPWMTGPVSPGTARVIMQADMSPASVKVRLQEQYANNSKVDGMVFCLIMRDKMFQEMQHSCDQEYAEKMCNRHNLTLLTVQDLTAHRKALLMAIVCHRNVQKASLMKTFHTTFTGVAVTRWVSTQQIAGTATILRQQSPGIAAATTTKPATDTSTTSTTTAGKTLPATKSFFSSFFGGSSSGSTSTVDNASSTGGRPSASSVSSSSSAAGSTAVTATASSNSGGTDGWIAISSSFPIQDEVVLYYFTFLGSGGQQGTIYLTMRYLCMVSSLMGFMNTKKEVFALADLTDYCVSTAGQEMTATGNSNNSSMNAHATNETATGGASTSTSTSTMGATLLGAFRVLKLVLHQGQREIVVRPMLVDAAKVHQMIAEIFAHFKPAASAATAEAAASLPQLQPQSLSTSSAST